MKGVSLKINRYNNRIGEISINSNGSVMEIIKYHHSKNIEVLFENGYITTCAYGNFKRGQVANPLDKTVYGIGYYGIGQYITYEKPYYVWFDMLKRCYDDKYLKKFNTYIGCSVCSEWHNFQNFAKWFDANYYIIDGTRMELDKDILFKGNKLYSPETCVFVPYDINYLFVKSNKLRGKYPIGVYLHSDGYKYVASCHDVNKIYQYLGLYDTPEEAFQVYKDYKEKTIKQVADKYCGLIPEKLYKALYNYKVEIID